MTQVDVYLDVDGVLNALHSKPGWGWSEESMRAEVINGFLIRWSTELVGRLNDLAALPHVQFHWLTTWLDLAPQMIAPPLGLKGAEEWPVLGAEDHDAPRKMSDYSWWKLHAARRHAEETGHRVVWIDDDLYDTSARQWATTLGDRIMLVQPDYNHGVTKPMMEKIEEWVGHG